MREIQTILQENISNIANLHRDELKPEVRDYADNLHAQIINAFTEKGITSLKQLEEITLSGKIPTRELANVQNLLEKLSLIVKTGELSTEDKKDFIVLKEVSAWKKVLGSDVEVKPLPKFITPEKIKKLKAFEFGLRYMPALDLKENLIGKLSLDDYADELSKLYPNWKDPDLLSEEERKDYTIPRNLNPDFWSLVMFGNILFPKLPGQWFAIELMEKPDWFNDYSRQQFTKMLGFQSRNNLSWYTINNAIKRDRENILYLLGLPLNSEVRFLEALEWNLLGNREGWGKTQKYEWTNTTVRSRKYLYIGSSFYGGAGAVMYANDIYKAMDGVGFRLAIPLA